MNKFIIFIIILLFSPCIQVPSQNIAPKILDTITYNENKIILFDNHTWSYTGRKKPHGSNTTLSVFDSFWDNDQIFAYRTKATPFPDYTEIDILTPGDSFTLPISGVMWGGFNRNHPGVDIGLHTGDHVKAAFNGKVRYAKFNYGGYGNLVIIRHENGLETYYAHLSQLWVAENQYIKTGDVIGLGGATGRTKGAHLHFELRYLDRALDPSSLIDFDHGKLYVIKLVLAKHSLDYEINYPVKNKQKVQTTKTNKNKQNTQKSKVVQNNQGGNYHTIRDGDTLSKIARNNGTTVSALCKLNNITPTTKLKIGNTIRIR